MATLGGNYIWKSYKAFSGALGKEYELTLFRIIADADGASLDASNGPVLFTHGFASDSISWFEIGSSDLAVGTKMANAGYDVWFANLRGTRYSRKNVAWNADNDDYIYWNFDISSYAEQDLPKMVKQIVVESKSCKKLSLIGHSMGTTVQLNSLSKSSAAARYISQSVNLAPCIIPDISQIISGASYDLYDQLETVFSLLGYYSLFGPDWSSQVDWICLLSLYGPECDTL